MAHLWSETLEANDRVLGRGHGISRCDFVNGVSVAVASSGFRLLRALALKERFAREEEADDYPPPKTGMCGSHVGSFEVTNQLCDRGNWDLSTAADAGEHDDLMVLGGGISRLSAKHFFLKNMANAKMVILDMS